jgi:hypothetical protein
MNHVNQQVDTIRYDTIRYDTIRYDTIRYDTHTSVQSTNWQSRTAMVIMPVLFTFAVSAERTLDHKMKEMANRNEHIRDSAVWAEKKHAENITTNTSSVKQDSKDTEDQLLELYRHSVAHSGVRVVPSLGPHHKVANFWQDHPFKVLAAMAVPAVGYIYYGRAGKEHLPMQMKIIHTRVMGQFAVISLLLTLMGFKEYMDRNGKFITEEESERRVEEMRQVREGLMQRLAVDKQIQANVDAQVKKAHEEDVKTGHVHEKKGKKAKKQIVKDVESITV